jgi:hypothetical protein
LADLEALHVGQHGVERHYEVGGLALGVLALLRARGSARVIRMYRLSQGWFTLAPRSCGRADSVAVAGPDALGRHTGVEPAAAL